MAKTLPDDVKTYTAAEAGCEWDSANTAKRRMVLARIAQRDSLVALKNWLELSDAEQVQIREALNEDFFSCAWYINKDGQRINLFEVSQPKSADLIEFERGQECWYRNVPNERFEALLACGIGEKDAAQGQFSTWGVLNPELRLLLLKYFDEKATQSAGKEKNKAPQGRGRSVKNQLPIVDPRQMDLFD